MSSKGFSFILLSTVNSGLVLLYNEAQPCEPAIPTLYSILLQNVYPTHPFHREYPTNLHLHSPVYTRSSQRQSIIIILPDYLFNYHHYHFCKSALFQSCCYLFIATTAIRNSDHRSMWIMIYWFVCYDSKHSRQIRSILYITNNDTRYEVIKFSHKNSNSPKCSK